MKGVAPLHLMAIVRIKDLLPSLRNNEVKVNDTELRERDFLAKEKGKVYGDRKRLARSSSIEVGDEVLVANKKLGKLQPNFTLTPFSVEKKAGNETWIKSKEHVSYRRCATDLKKCTGAIGRQSKAS